MAVVAPHGGFIERAIDTQARRVSTDERLLADVWMCRGRAGDAFPEGRVCGVDVFRVRAGLVAKKFSYLESEDFVRS